VCSSDLPTRRFLKSISATIELILLSTAIGLVATFAAPWYELCGTFAAWRIVVTGNAFGCGFDSKLKPE